ncbi:hypothetical protein GCM10027347_53430 [Larkinella harenae]
MQNNYYLLLQNISEALLILDVNGQVNDANPAASSLMGYSRGEFFHLSLAMLYPQRNDDIKMDYELTQARKQGKLVVEGWKVKKDGTLFWAEMTLAPAYDENHTLTGYTCLIRDVTQKKEQRLELRKSEERYRLMVEGVRDYAIFMLDTTGHIQTWNEGAKRIKGYVSDEIIGQHFSIFYTQRDLDDQKPQRELEIALATGKYEEEGWRIKKDGSIFWANVVITALFNTQNELVGFSKVTRDLTERKSMEEAIRRREELFRSLVEQVTDYGIFMLDEKGRIVSWNEGANRINGYSEEEIIGKYFSIFYPEEDILNGKPAYELKVARQSGKYEEEGWRLRKDGSSFWASIVITAVYNSAQVLIGFSKVTRDLTERKEAEKALRNSYEQQRLLAQQLQTTNEELAAMNEELAAMNDDMAESNRLLLRSNQSLQQFAYVASHDLQEPLRKILSFSTLLQTQFADQLGEGADYLERMHSAAGRMSALIRDLLTFSRLSTQNDTHQAVSLNAVVQQVVTDLELTIQETGAEVLVGALPTVPGNIVHLQQLFQNLLSNALKFRRQDVKPIIEVSAQILSGEELPVSIKPVRTATVYHRIEVSDNGIGFEEKYATRIFEVFQRLHTRSNYPGTGIGLAICEKVVANHGGTILARSQPMQGATFSIYLPVVDTE